MVSGPAHSRLVASEAFERTAKLVDVLAYATSADEVFQAIVDECRAGLGAQSAGAFLVDRERRQLVIAAHSRVADAVLDQFPLPLETEVPLTDAASTGVPIWIDDAAQRDRWYPRLKGSPIAVESSALVPIPFGGRTIGVLAVGFDGDHRFEETERSYCGILAALAGIAGGPRLKS